MAHLCGTCSPKRAVTMPNSTRDELKQAAEAMVEAYLSTRYPPEELTLGTEPGYHLARAILSAFEREEKMLEALKRIEPIIDAIEYFSPDRAVDGSIANQVRAAIKAAEEGV